MKTKENYEEPKRGQRAKIHPIDDKEIALTTLLQNIIDYDKAFTLIDEYKDNLFATEFVPDEEAAMFYYTILNWKEKSEMYDNLYN